MNHSILCVDDESDNVDALERLFRRKYKVFKATSADEGLEILKREHISLIISDQRMPHMTGVEFLKKSIKTHPEAIRILLTGYTDIESAIDAINSGQVYRYITKPWDSNDLSNTIDKAIEKYELSAELKQKNVELRAALDELKTLDEAKTNFMLLINHELKTPLTVILSFLELIMETELTAEQKKFLHRIGESSQRLKRLIDDSLELMSAETGQTKAVMRSFNIQDVIEEVVEAFETKAAEKGQTLLTSGEKSKVQGDANLVNKVLTRVLDNAIKFGAKDSEVVIEVTPQNEHVEIHIRNKGKAIPKEIVRKILEPFTLDENIMHHSEGLGLGLSITRAHLKLMESELHIQSEGGIVDVWFPLTLR